jgi:pectinesterase
MAGFFKLLSSLALCLFCLNLHASEQPLRVQVALDGSAPFRSVQQALDSLPATKQWALIEIGPGIYKEKLYLTRDKVVLAGSGKTSTTIEYPELRKNYLKQQPDDWGSAVVNIKAADIVLLDLTVFNSYGALYGDHDHQFAIRGFEQASRIITDQCRVIAGGADSLSLWNKQGLYYHSNCYFEGHVDYVCPRGTAWIKQSQFYSQATEASLWHDGELDQKAKLVVTDSKLSGIQGFLLGRRHYDAQFYLQNNQYSPLMANKPIFRKTYPDEPSRDRANLWGERSYFSGSSGASYGWLQNNWPKAVSQITEDWVYQGQWQPEQLLKTIRSWLNSKAQPMPAKLYLVGDSTMSDKTNLAYPERGWGQLLPEFMLPQLQVMNLAANGRSTLRFLNEGRWQMLIDELQAGDYVLIQFGHNDQKQDDPKRYAEVTTRYPELLQQFIREVKAKAAIPMLASSICRRNFKGNSLERDLAAYAAQAKQQAELAQVDFFDLQQHSCDLWQELGPVGSQPYFIQVPAGLYQKFPDGKTDNTHLSVQGASKVAQLFALELQKQQHALAQYIYRTKL